MAQYGKRQGRDTLENLLVRVGELEDKLKRLSGSPSRSSFDRGDTASVPDPIEGQTMIQYDDESPHYYSNGSWRTFGGTADSAAQSPITIPIDFCLSSNFGGPIVDNTLVRNCYITNTKNGVASNVTRTPALNDKFTTPYFFLGPKGSMWEPVIYWLGDTSGGQIGLELSSIGEDTARGADSGGSLDHATADWIEIDNGIIEDLSVATGETSHNYIPFRLTGNPGDPFTTFGDSADPETSANTIDGGSGVYSLRVTVVDAGSSSGGYLAQISAITLVRVDDNGWGTNP